MPKVGTVANAPTLSKSNFANPIECKFVRAIGALSRSEQTEAPQTAPIPISPDERNETFSGWKSLIADMQRKKTLAKRTRLSKRSPQAFEFDRKPRASANSVETSQETPAKNPDARLIRRDRAVNVQNEYVISKMLDRLVAQEFASEEAPDATQQTAVSSTAPTPELSQRRATLVHQRRLEENDVRLALKAADDRIFRDLAPRCGLDASAMRTLS